MQQDVQAEFESLHTRLDHTANALTQVHELLLAAGLSIIVLRAMLATLADLSTPEVRQAFRRTLQSLQPPDAISELHQAEFVAAREQLLVMLKPAVAAVSVSQ